MPAKSPQNQKVAPRSSDTMAFAQSSSDGFKKTSKGEEVPVIDSTATVQKSGQDSVTEVEDNETFPHPTFEEYNDEALESSSAASEKVNENDDASPAPAFEKLSDNAAPVFEKVDEAVAESSHLDFEKVDELSSLSSATENLEESTDYKNSGVEQQVSSNDQPIQSASVDHIDGNLVDDNDNVEAKQTEVTEINDKEEPGKVVKNDHAESDGEFFDVADADTESLQSAQSLAGITTSIDATSIEATSIDATSIDATSIDATSIASTEISAVEAEDSVTTTIENKNETTITEDDGDDDDSVLKVQRVSDATDTVISEPDSNSSDDDADVVISDISLDDDAKEDKVAVAPDSDNDDQVQ